MTSIEQIKKDKAREQLALDGYMEQARKLLKQARNERLKDAAQAVGKHYGCSMTKALAWHLMGLTAVGLRSGLDAELEKMSSQ